MKRSVFTLSFIAVCLLAASPAAATGRRFFQTTLSGYDEVPPTFTTGHGAVRLEINKNDTAIDFTLTYADLSAAPAAAHIHFGQPGVAGGVMVFFCGGGGKPACPASTSGTVTGSITAADVVGPVAQGIQPGDFAAVLAVLRAHRGYANMHTANFPAGEIRGNFK